MHLLATSSTSLDEIVEPIDLCQPPGDVLVLSFADSDLAGLAAAWAAALGLLAGAAAAVVPWPGCIFANESDLAIERSSGLSFAWASRSAGRFSPVTSAFR
jgi:cobaltochelatase CobN